MSTKSKDINDNTLSGDVMLEDNERCSCWDKESEKEQRWRAEVMADGKGYCKHCCLKMSFYYPLPKEKKPRLRT